MFSPRLNIGIRTITATTVNISIYNAAGTLQGMTSRSYPADYFEQITASAFISGANVRPGGRIVASAFEKGFIVYGAVTDNRTNDPSMRVGLD